jgi:hypothetical protein
LEENKKRLKSRNAGCHSVKLFCFSDLISKHLMFKLHGNINSLVLCECEISSLKLREDRRLNVFGSRVLRKIFVSNKDGVKGQWRELSFEELSDLYVSPNIFRLIKTRWKNWEVHVHYWGEERCIEGFGGDFYGKETTW